MEDKVRKILIVDDNPENIKVVANTLNAANIGLAFAMSGKEALGRLKKSSFDLVLMDVMMPDMDGFETVKQIKENPDNTKLPIIFLTAMDDEDSIEKAFEIGGADYIRKPFRPRELIVRVQYQLERKEFLERLDYLASKDILTGIYNRRKFFELAIALFEQPQWNIYGVIVDIDYFKSFNDTYGHQAGDNVIKLVTSILDFHQPEGAVLGRIGGEEFAIVFTSESIDVARAFCENIRRAVEATECETEGGEKLKCTISVGLAEKTSNIKRIDQLLNEADQMLYEAKKSGRNRIGFRKKLCRSY